MSPGAVRVAAFALKVAFGTELGTQHTLGGGRVVARPGNTCLEQSCACAITWEPSFVCLRCRSKLTVQEAVSKRLQGWRVLKRSDLEQEAQELHVASLHGAGDPQLGLLIICMENVILCHVPTQRVCRVQQLGRSFGIQNRFFFFLLKMRKSAVKWSLRGSGRFGGLWLSMPGWNPAALDALAEEELLLSARRT